MSGADLVGVRRRSYLTAEKGIDTKQIRLRVGKSGGRSETNLLVPVGATYSTGDTVVVESKSGR
jgi:hypothetical protein